MTRPTFSIIIPCYNYGHLVHRAINSVMSQQREDFEVVVVNDGSTDTSAEVIARLVKQYPRRLRSIQQQNRGQSAARNRGIDASTGEWLVFLDADDEMLPGALDAYARDADLNPSARLLAAGHISEDGAVRKTIPAYEFGLSREANFKAYLWKHASLSNGACAMHRSIFGLVRYEETLRHSEDIGVFAAILALFRVVPVPVCTLVVHKHADSLRHDYAAAKEVGMTLEGAVFDRPELPAWTQKYRAPYRARRALSLMKLAYNAGEYQDTKHFFMLALRSDWRQTLRPGYMRRFVVALGRSEMV